MRLLTTTSPKASPMIREHGGFVDRYSGDAIMALFPNDAEDALKAAIRTLKVIAIVSEQTLLETF